jgi:hypothetical protein
MISVMAAVLAVLLVIFVWYIATHGKGLVVARLMAWLLLILAILVLVAIKDPGLAGSALAGFAHGISQAVSGLVNFIKAL